MHVGPAVAAAKLGYHLLLEKPMATTLKVACRHSQIVLSCFFFFFFYYQVFNADCLSCFSPSSAISLSFLFLLQINAAAD